MSTIFLDWCLSLMINTISLSILIQPFTFSAPQHIDWYQSFLQSLYRIQYVHWIHLNTICSLGPPNPLIKFTKFYASKLKASAKLQVKESIFHYQNTQFLICNFINYPLLLFIILHYFVNVCIYKSSAWKYDHDIDHELSLD